MTLLTIAVHCIAWYSNHKWTSPIWSKLWNKQGVRMVATKPKTVPQSNIRWTEADFRIVQALQKRLGVDISQIIRLGIRALATKEGVTF